MIVLLQLKVILMALRHHNIHPITAEQFDYLNLRPDWQIVSVPEDNWRKIPNLPRINDTLGIYASGCPQSPQTFNDIEHVGACDIVAYEANPQIEKGEISINIYHCVFQKLKSPTSQFEYLMHYPFKSGTLAPHWPKDLEDLQIYWRNP